MAEIGGTQFFLPLSMASITTTPATRRGCFCASAMSVSGRFQTFRCIATAKRRLDYREWPFTARNGRTVFPSFLRGFDSHHPLQLPFQTQH